MSITFPRTDIMDAVNWAPDSAPLRLVSRQELSRQANGITRGKDLGSALWFGDFTTAPLPIDRALAFEAMMNSLDGVLMPFEAGDMRDGAQYPAAYPTGDFSDSGQLLSVNANNKAIALSNLPANFAISVGCYLEFTYDGSRALHQVVEAITANGSGTTAQFEVRPHLREGWEVGDAVTFKRPRGLFTLMPDSVSARFNGGAHTVVSFKAVQYL